MREIVIEIIKKALKEEKLDLTYEEVDKLIEVPSNQELGDFAFPCFVISARLKQEPFEAALQIREKIGNFSKEYFEDIQTLGPYVNFYINKNNFSRGLIKQILKQKDKFGKNNLAKNQKIIIEYSQPNTHKSFHVGHIRGTSLGESLSRIAEFCGGKVIRANYQGDTGMHVAKWLWCYQKYHSKVKIKKDEAWIASIYVDAVKRLSKDKKLQKQVDEINQKLGTKEDKKLNKLWEKTRKISLQALEKVYKELNTHFDVYFFESDVEKKGFEIIDKLLASKVARVSQGAVIINLKRYKLGVWVLLRKDKTILYSGKDLSLAEKKSKKYKLDRSIYVVANEQDLHLRQLFKTLELMKFEDAKKLQHVSYGMVRFPHGKMSSRTGDNILYSDLLEKIKTLTRKRIEKRKEKMSEKELKKRTLAISIAAMKYPMLKQGSNKNIIFDIKEATNFEGDTGPYIQYSYARACSILRKAKKDEIKNFEMGEMNPKEIELLKKLSRFPEIVLNAYNNLNPALVTNYSYSLAKIFNEFYHESPVIGSKEEDFRISLVKSFKQVLKNSLGLLAIETLEKM